MTLELIPDNELTFRGPFNAVSVTTLKLSNSGSERLAYKIKTTAPKRYCVKPNSGFLAALATTEVQVMLQPQPAGQADDRTKHKFMVQWVAVPNSTTENVDNFWKQDLKALGVQDSKLKCVFADEQPVDVVLNDAHPVADSNTPTARVIEQTNVTENRLQQQQPATSVFTTRSPSSNARSVNPIQSTSQDRPQESVQESNVSRFKEDIDRLRQENEALQEKIRNNSNVLRQRPTTGSPAPGTAKSSQSQVAGPVLFGIPVTEQLLLVAFLIALLLGFSFGYFLFSCNN